MENPLEPDRYWFVGASWGEQNEYQRTRFIVNGLTGTFNAA